MIINRQKLEDFIIDKTKNFPCVVLLGLRQVGKTTISRNLEIEISKFLDLEVTRDYELLLADAEGYLENFNSQTVVIDEAQILPKLYSSLRPIIDRNNRNSQFILLGSANPLLIKGISESLTGRVAYIEIYPFTIEEVGEEQLLKRWLRGGLPKSFTATEDHMAFDWLTQYIMSYVERDLNKLFGIQFNSILTKRLLSILASINGSMLNSADLARSLGVSAASVNNYIDFLEGAFFIYKLNPWHANVTKRLVKSAKIYISDEGILHSLVGVSFYNELIDHQIVGASWEGFVINQIRSKVGRKLDLYFYRTQIGAEIDLVLVKNNKPVVAIEIKHSNTPSISKGFYIACDDLNIEHKYVITKSDGGFTLKNVRVEGFSNFILSEINKFL